MSYPSVTYTFVNGTKADGGQVNTNFTDLINALSDGTVDLYVDDIVCDSLTCASLTAPGTNTTYGNIHVAEYIYHKDDTDTNIRYQDNQVTINAGGTSALDITTVTTLGMNVATGAKYISRAGTAAGLSLDASNNATLSANLAVTGNLTIGGTLTLPYAQIKVVAKSGAAYATIQSAIDSITDNTSTKRYLIWVMPGLYEEQITMKSWVDVRGADRRAVQVQYTGNNNGTFILAAYTQISNLRIESTLVSTEWAIVGTNTGNIHIRNVDILAPIGDTSYVGQGIKITGNSWTTVFIEGCVLNYNGTTGWGIYLTGNSTTPQNCDCHLNDVFADSLYATTGGSVYVKDINGIRTRGCLLRSESTSTSGCCVKTERTAGTVNILLDSTTCEYGNPSISHAAATTVFTKHSAADTVSGSGVVSSWGHCESAAFYTGRNTVIGKGVAGTDYTLTFDGETNDGVITWMEDEDYFKFTDDVLINAGEYVYLRDTSLSITSLADSYIDLIADGAIRLNNSAANTDVVLTFTGTSNSGTVTWMEDEDYFKYSDDLLIDSNESIYFRDSAISINSADDGRLDLNADTSIDLNNSIVIGAGAATNYTITFNADTNDGILTFVQSVGQFKFDKTVNVDVGANTTGRYLGSLTDLAHAMTDFLPTDAFIKIAPASATGGGAIITAATEQDVSDVVPFTFRGLIGMVCNDGTLEPAFVFDGGYKNGTGYQALSAGYDIAQFKSGGTEKLSIEYDGSVNTAEVYKVDGTQVVGPRVIDARANDDMAGVINTGDGATDAILGVMRDVIDALRDACISHGLIAAA